MRERAFIYRDDVKAAGERGVDQIKRRLAISEVGRQRFNEHADAGLRQARDQRVGIEDGGSRKVADGMACGFVMKYGLKRRVVFDHHAAAAVGDGAYVQTDRLAAHTPDIIGKRATDVPEPQQRNVYLSHNPIQRTASKQASPVAIKASRQRPAATAP